MSEFTVFGGSGVIGHRLVTHLRDAGHQVGAPGRDPSDWFVRALGHVIYAIGITADFRKRPLETVEAHVGLLGQLLMHGQFDSLLYLSSTRLYAGASSGSENAVFQVSPQHASDLYNLSKLMGESLCLQSGVRGVRVARLSNVVGGEDSDSDNFIPTLIREARAGRVVLRTAPSSAKDYIHIDDVVEILPRIALSGQHTVYNVASGKNITHQQWLTQLQIHTGCTIEVANDALTVCFPNIDISRIRSEFGFEARPAQDVLTASTDRLILNR